MTKTNVKVTPATGKLGILLPGMGAVATTFIAGVEAVKRGLAEPVGSLTQMGRLRLGKRSENRSAMIKDFISLSSLENVCFGGWDIFEDDVYQAASKAKVLEQTLLDQLREPLSKIKPMSAVFDNNYIALIDGKNKKSGRTKKDLADQLREDIKRFKKDNHCDRLVMVWCASTERYTEQAPCHETIAKFEKGLLENDPMISPSQIYAYAALMERVPYANGSPNRSVECPALQELAKELRVAICGSDFKTGQTLMKTVLAPGLKSRLLGLSGWYSTNILGNRDGEVLADPGSFKSKEVSKLSVLDQILEPETYPSLYGDVHHQVQINYYPPRGDNKEGWDNIDIFGWLGYPMQIKVNFLCRDSILAAPIVLDLALFMDLAQRAELFGIQEWLSFYFKSPLAAPSLKPEHDLQVQLLKLHNTLRFMGGEELINHLGLTYYGIVEE
ncbi:MAG: inositol-3-phosphate synthase [Deltaproteobacteria bacterium]